MKIIGIVAFAVLAVARPSAAGDKIVLESFTGGKTDDGGTALAPLLRALANQGFVGGDTLRARFEERGSRPALVKPLPGSFADQLEAGQRAWFEGNYEEAINKIGALVADAHASPGAFAQSQDARAQLESALFVLAMSEQRRNNGVMAKRWFAELLRSFPQTAPARGKYGPDAVKTFEDVKKEVLAGGRGKLEVRANVDGAAFFVNEKFEAMGNVRKDNLLAGEYRVFAQFGKQLSRVHTVTVKPGDTAVVVINAAFDTAVQTSPTWTGLAYSNAADRDKYEVGHAASFGSLLDAEAIAVVGIEDVHGKPAIVGALVSRDSRQIRAASVALEPVPSEIQMKAFAEFLAGENLKPEGIEVLPIDKTELHPEGPHRRDDDDRPGVPQHGRWGGWKYVAGGTAIVALGVGAVLVKLDGTCPETIVPPNPCPDLYNTGVPGYLSLGGGVAAAAISVYLFVHKAPAAPARSAYVLPTNGGALAGFTARF